jgi:hypothetical protein
LEAAEHFDIDTDRYSVIIFPPSSSFPIQNISQAYIVNHNEILTLQKNSILWIAKGQDDHASSRWQLSNAIRNLNPLDAKF